MAKDMDNIGFKVSRHAEGQEGSNNVLWMRHQSYEKHIQREFIYLSWMFRKNSSNLCDDAVIMLDTVQLRQTTKTKLVNDLWFWGGNF